MVHPRRRLTDTVNRDLNPPTIWLRMTIWGYSNVPRTPESVVPMARFLYLHWNYLLVSIGWTNGQSVQGIRFFQLPQHSQ